MMRIVKAYLLIIFLCLWPALTWGASSAPTSQPSERFLAYPRGVPDLTSPGFHKLIYQWNEDGQVREIRFSLFLPNGYGTDDRRWPMLTFLSGLGDRGTDPGNAMAVGAPLEIGRSAELGEWMPMIVLAPQCPSDKVWGAPDMAQAVLRLIDAVANRFPVDSSRLFVSGFSDGGKGCWVLAANAPRLFAVVAPIVSREYQAQETARRLTGGGTTCLVISGLKDEKSEPASAHMVAALRQQGVDVVYAPVPDAGHFIWRAFYSQRGFYEWLLLHRRGQSPPKDRPDGQHFVAVYQSSRQLSIPQQLFEHQMQSDLDHFEPYWFIDNFAQAPGVGLVGKRLGRENVYVAVPLSLDLPCRLQTTRQLPKDKVTTLALEVGHLPKCEWELVVRVNEQEQLRQLVNDETAPSGWLSVKVNLASYAGSEARLQLIQNATRQSVSAGCWGSIKLIETAVK